MIPDTIVVGVLSAVGGLAVGYLGKRASQNAAAKALHGIERQIAFDHAAKIAEFRQAWINDLREAMATFQSIGIPKDDPAEQELRRIRTKIELLMNRRDDKYPELHRLMHDMGNAIANDDSSWFNAPFVELCEDILKTEWEVLKRDLANGASPGAVVPHRIP
jgi:hypothetical protein